MQTDKWHSTERIFPEPRIGLGYKDETTEIVSTFHHISSLHKASYMQLHGADRSAASRLSKFSAP
jgi:hypothetical protein